MKKLIYIPILTVIMIFCLQGLWISKIYRSYINQSMQIIEQTISTSIQKEIGLRQYSPYVNPNAPKIIVKDADKMTLEERYQLKGDTLNLDSLEFKNIGSNILEVIVQFQQDGLMNSGMPIQITKLDSIFCQELKNLKICANYCILTYNKDTILTKSIGTLPPKTKNLESTILFPIGTKGLQFIQVKADIPLSLFLQEMLYILLESITLAVIILACVIYLIIAIRKKDKLFKQRETSVNGIVHGLKSPLNGIITLMSYLKKKTSDSTTLKLIEDTSKQTHKLVNEIESLLITARKDRQKIYLQKVETDLIQLATDICQEISMQHNNKTYQIRIETKLKNLNLMLDPLYITNVIRNLIENALKYSDNEVKIIIGISKDIDKAILTVKDNGWGIDYKYQNKIFTQFYQAPRRQTAHQQGYGIGLAYVKYIMEEHGGNITVESIIEKGSTFICKFPLR